MDRHIVYPGQIPLETDLLHAAKDSFMGLGWLAASAIGSSVAVAGLAVTPTSPASLQVNVAPGAIYSLQTVDANSYGSLGVDGNQVVKQGISAASSTLTITPPTTVGQSTNYLVQVAFSEVDSSPVILPYYNAANPSVGWAGPGNSGSAQNTVRSDAIAIGIKAGSPAPTGSQTTPSPDAGYTGIYVVTVANGATTITSGNISLLGTAPFFAALPQIPGAVQNNQWTSAVATGTATALVITLTPAPAAYTKFMSFEVQVPSAAAGATTVNVNGLGAPAVVDKSGAPILPGFWQANDILSLTYDGTSFRVVGGQTTVTTAFSSSYSTSQALSNNVLSQSALTAGSAAFGAVASNAFTFTRPGSYNIAARTTVGVVQSAGNSNFLGAVQIRKNNVPVVGGYSEDSSFGNSGTFNREVNVTIAVAAGDAITLWAQCGASSGYVSASIVGMTIAIQALS